MTTIKRDTTHRILEEDFIRMNAISKKMMKEVDRRRETKARKELSSKWG